MPVANGQDASTNGVADEQVPTPPPHRSQPSSPVQTAAEEAENHKNEGNKFFKLKDYGRAVECYTKGKLQQFVPLTKSLADTNTSRDSSAQFSNLPRQSGCGIHGCQQVC